MKKSVTFIVVFIALLLLFTNIIYAQINPQDLTDEERKAYDYGKDKKKLAEFFSLYPNVQKNIAGDYGDVFLTGLKDGNNMDLLLEEWVKTRTSNGNTVYVLGDDAKNALFKKLMKEDKELLKKILNKKLERFKKNYPDFYNKYYKPIEEITIDDSLLEKLEWRGGKFGFINDKGELEAWIDFNKPPILTDRIRFITENGKEKISLDISAGDFRRTIKFNEGSINEIGSIVKKNGEVFGFNSNGIEGYRWDNNNQKLEVDYYDINGEMQTLSLEEDVLKGKMSEELLDVLKGKGFAINEDSGKKAVRDFLNKLGYVDIGNFKSNQVNLFFSQKGVQEKGETEFSFDNDGNLEVSTKNGANVVTLNSDKRVSALLYPNPELKENGLFRFNKHGELTAVQSAEGILFGRDGWEIATFQTGKDIVGARIVRSTLADAIATGDVNRILDFVASEIESGIENKQLLQRILKGERIDVQMEAISMLQEQLNNPDLNIELRNRIKDAISVFRENIAQSGENVFNQVFKNQRSWDEIMNDPGAQFLADRTFEQSKQAFAELTKPENIGTLLDFYNNPSPENEKKLNDIIQRAVTEQVQGYDDIFKSGFSRSFSETISDLGLKGKGEQKIRDEINSWINKQNFVEMIRNGMNGNENNVLRTKFSDLLEKNKITGNEKEALLKSYDSMQSRIITAVEAEKLAFRERFTLGLKELLKSEYDTNFMIDTQSGAVRYQGTKRVVVDTKVPLQEVRVNHQDTGKNGDVFILRNNGKEIAWFDGDKTYTSRGGYGNINNIYSIVNENKANGELIALSDGRTYSIVNPKDPSNVKSVINQYGNMHVYGIPLINYVDVTTHHLNLRKNPFLKDIGEDLDAEARLTVMMNPSRTGARGLIFPNGPLAGLFDRIARKKANEKITEQMMQIPAQRSKVLAELGPSIDEQINNLYAGIGNGNANNGRETLSKHFESGNKVLEWADKNNVDIPYRTAINDVITLKRMDDTGQLKQELTNIADWALQQRINRWTVIRIVNDPKPYLEINNDRYYADPAIIRMALRGTDIAGNRIPSRFRSMQGGTPEVFIQGQGWKRVGQ